MCCFKSVFIKLILCCALLSSCLIGEPALAQSLPAPIMNDGNPEQTSEAGYYTLSWERATDSYPEDTVFELEESENAAFTDARLVYRGTDRSSTLSGKADGVFFYRVRAVSEFGYPAGSWSALHRVIVSHHPLQRSLLFLVVGALVFAATTWLVVFGNRGERQ